MIAAIKRYLQRRELRRHLNIVADMMSCAPTLEQRRILADEWRRTYQALKRVK